jgi:iron complex outermembrane receptor protein
VASHSQARLAIGEKHRFPTMRELYGTAVNRFLINPSLQPEKSRSLELGYEYNDESLNAVATAFYQKLDNTIDQRRVDGLRQRINLRGTDIYGLELVGQWQVNSHWAVDVQGTVMNATRARNHADEPKELSERPEVLARLKARYQVLPSLGAVMEYERRGHSYSQDPQGELRKLSGASLIHFGFDWTLPQSWSKALKLNARINNVTDEYYEFQSGLPAAGREFRLSVTWQK